MNPHLSVPSLVLPAVTARREGLGAEVARERFLAGVAPQVHLVIRFCLETLTTNSFYACYCEYKLLI